MPVERIGDFSEPVHRRERLLSRCYDPRSAIEFRVRRFGREWLVGVHTCPVPFGILRQLQRG